MDFEKFDFPKIETMSGSEEGSTFLVIAKNKAVKLGVRAFLAPFVVNPKSTWIALGFRFRAEGAGFDVNVDMAKESFGNFPFKGSKHHSSAVGMVPLVAFPCSPTEVATQYLTFDGQLEINIVEQVKEQLAKVNGSLCLDESLIIESLRESVKDLLPEVKVTVNEIPKMLWISQKSAG